MLNTEWGLMIWTLITFAIAVFILWRFAFGPVQKLIEQRRANTQAGMDAAEAQRAEAHKLLEEYKDTLAKVREEAAEILERSRAQAERSKGEIMAEARVQSERVMARAEEQIQRDTRAALRELKGQVAELTALATEKVTAGGLTAADQERLIEAALDELKVDELGMESRG